MSGSEGAPAPVATPEGGGGFVAGYAVKVDNAPSARPQWGLAEAVAIVELPVEGGMTRLVALFDGPPGEVGPVRSSRPVDADLLAPFATTVVTSGGQRWVLDLMAAAGIDLVTPASRSDLFEAVSRPAPSNLSFLGGASVGSSVGRSLAGPLPTGGDPTSSITIPYGPSQVTSFTWTGSSYERSQDGAPHTVLTGLDGELEVLEFEAVLVLTVEQRWAGYNDSAGTPVPTFDVIGFGDGLLLVGGESFPIEWRRAAQSKGFTLISEGREVGVPSGRLAIQLISTDMIVPLQP